MHVYVQVSECQLNTALLYQLYLIPSSPTETLSGLVLVRTQKIYFHKTIDLPCFLFNAAVFVCFGSLFAVHFKMCVD